MYLKSLELVGFKSFADKTRLDFEPGMTAIVGPNGCGKSNVSDAIRWVLGEQSAKALRGGSMQDCIFNGTDERKPLGMAEVSMTLADCEEALGTEYHEVTVTRRVFRSGEGQYFLNKTPCRLKDIQRLFMDTGIGTDSYSLMEQGRIDQILSARPEDRRAVFEEASGITKFKADKKEADRKLDHTEANLLRLADVIREVKRRIGSLQRQAGKARRYQALKEELRSLDVFLTQGRVTEAEANQAAQESQAEGLRRQIEEAHSRLVQVQEEETALRNQLADRDARIATVLETGVQAKSDLEHTQALIEMNRQRIDEYRALSVRDAKANDIAKARLAQQEQRIEDLAREREDARRQEQTAREQLEDVQAKAGEHRERVDDARGRIQQCREQSLQRERQISRIQNELAEMDARERSALLQRERLATEKSRLARLVTASDSRQAEVEAELDALREDANRAAEELRGLEQRRAGLLADLDQVQRKRGELESETAALKAQVEILDDEEGVRQDFPAGARLLLDGPFPPGIRTDEVLGPLADHIEIPEEYRPALEGALRAWRDAVVVRDSHTGHRILAALESREEGSLRLAPAAAPDEPGPAHMQAGGTRLVEHISCTDAVRALVRSLLGHVVVVESLDALPPRPWNGMTCVTRSGVVLHASGCMELWKADAQASSPLSRKHRLARARTTLRALEEKAGAAGEERSRLAAQIADLDPAIDEARRSLDTARHRAAQKEGENQVVTEEAAVARERLETVSWELEALQRENESDRTSRTDTHRHMEELQAERDAHAEDIAKQTEELRQIEARHSEIQSALTEQRVEYARVSQRKEHLAGEWATAQERLRDIGAAVKDRAQGIESYAASISRLETTIAQAEGSIRELEATVRRNAEQTESLKRERQGHVEQLKQKEAEQEKTRASVEEMRDAKSEIDVRCTEMRMRRQNQVERMATEYGLSEQEFLAAPAPEWGAEGIPPAETMETRLAELRTKLEAMGPVNLIAIEEYKELQERYEFLTEQEEDLRKAKQQLMELIRKINRTTSEMFSRTFQNVNENFQTMFRTLFGGGTAKLVLVNEEDVLECGIEIIARPPGKRLQNVSLLSGGERTLTAVSLLLAIYMIKPSPFCLLDELDAALDDSNIGRFIKILRGFLGQSQFVVITHNQQTISAARALYGVTMEKRGISKIVSVRFMPHEADAGEHADRAPVAERADRT